MSKQELFNRLIKTMPNGTTNTVDFLLEKIEELEQQLDNATKQNVMLREALEAERKLRVFGQSPECGQTHWESIRDMRRTVYDATERALAATDDLKGVHLCDAEQVAFRTFDGEGNYDFRDYYLNEDYQEDWNNRNPNHKGWVEPLYRAWEPKL